MLDPAYFLGFAQGAAQDIALWLRYVQTAADISWKVISGVGVILGGIWAYYKFVKGRAFQPNLAPKVAGEARYRGREIYLVVTTEVENVGASKVDIDKKLTLVRVLTAKPIPGGVGGSINWTPFGATRILEGLTHLEPGERAVDTGLFQIPDEGYIGLRLEVYVASTREVAWVGIGVVNLAGRVDNALMSGERS